MNNGATKAANDAIFYAGRLPFSARIIGWHPKMALRGRKAVQLSELVGHALCDIFGDLCSIPMQQTQNA